MNSSYRSLWNDKTGTFVAVSENANSAGKKTSSCRSASGATGRFALKTLAVSLLLSFGVTVHALPTGGVVAAGGASISSGALATTITQSTQNVVINWQSFGIGSGEAVRFLQPNSNSVALNRVLGSDPSSILGSLTANGKVFLVNPNGILFGQGASVNVGGLVASTLNLSDSDFLAGSYKFVGAGSGTLLNQGAISADGGYVALLGANVTNNGVIQAKLGSVVLAAGTAITLDVAGDGLLNVTVNQGAVNALVQNGGLIQADGGQVYLTAQAAGGLLQSAVNNSGVIQAQTLQNHKGTIKLLGDMQYGTANVAGTLDASAPKGGDGGFIETSAAHVNVADNTNVTTRSAAGKSGSWLIDPVDFTIAARGGNITGTTLSSNLAGGSVSILSSAGTSGIHGDINVNAPVSWSANTLTLTAAHDININAVMTASGTSLLVMNTATANGLDAAVAGGAVRVGMNEGAFSGRVDFPYRSGAGFLTINGLGYTVIDLLGAPGSITGTDLQGINGSAANLAKNYALGTNIDATATSTVPWGVGFLPIGTFTGNFDGLGHTITGLTIHRTGTANVGLFGKVAAGTSTIRNVGLVGGSVSGDAGTGGLIGDSGAGNTISNSFNTGSVSGDAGTGGLIGSNGAGNTVSNSYATGAVNGTVGKPGIGGLIGSNGAGSPVTYSYATGNVTSIGGASVGGLVGSNTTGTVTDSYATGSASGAAGVGGLIGSNTSGAVNNSYATGFVTASGPGVGGLLGSSNAGVVVHSYWDTTTSGQAASAGGGVGMTTAQMKAQVNFASSTAANLFDAPAWNFATTWFMYEGISYPLLRPFMTLLTVSANSDSKTYNGIAYSGANGVTYSKSTNSIYLFGSLSYSYSGSGGASVGSYTITPGGLYSNQQGYIIDYASGVMTINPAHLTVTADNQSRLYGAANPPLSTTVSGFVNGETAGTAAGFGGSGSATTTAGVGTGVGTATITAGAGTLTASNYDFATLVNGTLTINPAQLTVTASNVSKAYGQTPTLTAFTAAGLVNGDTVTSVTETSPGTVASASVAGSPYVITPSNAVGSFTPSNYTIGYVNGVLTVTPIALTVTASNVSKAYGQTPTLTAFTAAGLVNGDTVTSVTETSPGALATAGVAGSPYVITPSNATGSFTPSNYILGYVNGVLTVTPVPLTVTASNVTKTYGQTPTLSGFTTTALVNGETVGSVTETSPGAPASAPVAGSPYPITPSGATGGTFTPSNYTIGYVNGVLTVTPKALTGSITAADKIYDATTIAVITGRTLTGALPTDTVSYIGGTATFDTPDVGVGKTVTGVGLSLAGVDAGNYTVNSTATTTASITPLFDFTPPVVAPYLTPVNWIPVIVQADTPPELLTVAAPVPPTPVPAPPPPPTVLPEPAPVVVPVQPPPEIYVAPHRPRKQDRN